MAPKQGQKGWKPAKQAAAEAEKKHRQAAIAAAKKGKGPAPAYKEERKGFFRW